MLELDAPYQLDLAIRLLDPLTIRNLLVGGDGALRHQDSGPGLAEHHLLR